MKKMNLFILFFLFLKILSTSITFAEMPLSVTTTSTETKINIPSKQPPFISEKKKFENLYLFAEQVKNSKITPYKLLELIIINIDSFNIDSFENQKESECENIFDAIDKKNLNRILKYKNQINSINTYGQTPIIYTLFQNQDLFEVIYILILLGADINKTDEKGNHPLMIAISNQRLLSLKALLQFNLNVNQLYKNPDLSIGFASNYKTPLALAYDKRQKIRSSKSSSLIKNSVLIMHELIRAGAKD